MPATSALGDLLRDHQSVGVGQRYVQDYDVGISLFHEFQPRSSCSCNSDTFEIWLSLDE